MEQINYIGEHLLPGIIGRLAILSSFIASLLAAYAWFMATQNRANDTAANWQKIGRGSFLVHALSVFTVIGCIFYAMIKQYYEYQYVQAHVSEDLPLKYIFSAFWEGQEGSFLLWMFWHIVLGFILLLRAGKWEAPVLSVLSLIQVFIGSMLLGIYVGFGEEPARIGSNPMMLLRDVMDAPIFANADYVSLLQGTGLNPLLQNYWMTIHPPTLFLGFASTAIPFAFAVAGLWTNQHQAWLKPALPWALFSGGILGIGILMGGAWAYEALSFGGYWAWDPVENMSLVPWLVLVAGLHTNLVAKNTGHSIRSTYVFYLLTFILIVYSTFLTRSGVLGETSVHAFTEMGLEWQLILFIAAFLLLSIALMAAKYKQIPHPEKEESSSSREFWMFIGSLVLLFSALIITASTSLPVYNKIVQFFDPTFEGKVITDPEPHYNKYQIWIALFLALLSGFSQFLRYKERNFSGYFKKMLTYTAISAVGAGLLTLLTAQWIELKAWQYGLLLFFALFTLVSNFVHVFAIAKGNRKAVGSAMSHIGFGMMVVGVLASSLNKRVISNNPFLMEGLIEGASEDALRKNVLLFKHSPLVMDRYELTYTKDTVDKFTRTFTVEYKRRDPSGKVVEQFELYPNILYDKSFTKVASSNPSTRRYWDKDVFTHIASLPQVEIDMEYRKQREDSLRYKTIGLEEGRVFVFQDTTPVKDRDTFIVREWRAFLEKIDRKPSHPEYQPQEEDLAIGAVLQLQRMDEDSIFRVEPVIVLRGQLLYSFPVQINELSTRLRLNEQIFDVLFTPEEALDYQSFTFKQGDELVLNGQNIRFSGFNREPEHPNYLAREEDIAVSAMMEVQAGGSRYTAQPVYLIRGNQPFNLKAEIPELGLHFRFVAIDPQRETIDMMIAHADRKPILVPIDIATNSLRSDYIVLEAIEFPGINLFWLGSTLMMLGMLFSMAQRLAGRRQEA